MCGIVGVIEASRPAAVDALKRATDQMLYRGPDDGGVWNEGHVGLAHRRLAVLDLSPAGHQPMHSHNGRYVIVFNGEIYNFMELRRQLADDDSWRGHSDTEVVLAAYEKWGVDCISRFRGMFAFAIWDREQQVLFVARDRMGVKPLYFHHSSERFVFASRPSVVASLCPESSGEVDQQALRYFLECGYVPAPYTIDSQIRKLPPAHYLVLKNGEVTCKRYWDYRHIVPEQSWKDRKEGDLLDELDEIASRAVHSRMVSDVPLGAFLSGGIDSALVVALMAKHSSQPIKTFTIGFDELNYDESGFAQAISENLGTEHHCEHMRVDDLLALMPTFQKVFDEPFFDSSAFPVMAVSRLARRHVTVSLSGDGGDELFGGYHYYHIADRLAAVLRLPRAVRTPLALVLQRVPHHRLNLLAGALRGTDRAATFAYLRSIAKDFGGVLNTEVMGSTQGLDALFASAAKNFAPGLAAGEEGMRLDAMYVLPDDYLQKVDVGSMAFSLESREPLLDHDLVEWGMRLPQEWKLRERTNKYLLRKLAYRYIPQPLLDRPKRGFSVPIDQWLRGPLKSWALDRIESRELFEKLPLDQDKVRNLFALHLSGKRNVHPLLWAILTLLDFTANKRTSDVLGRQYAAPIEA